MNQPPLKPLHSDDRLNRVKIDKLNKLSDKELIDSLQPGQDGSLKVRPDGIVLDGHQLMAARAYWIEGSWRGRLAIVPRPRGGDWLEDEIADWREAGIDTVVSFLTPDEVAEFNLEAEKELSEAHGIRFISFPIPDRGVPASKVAAASLAHDLEQSLAEGKKIALHCRQSVGRSALLAAYLIVDAGEDSRSAFDRIRSARGVPVPDTAEQEQWVADHASVPVKKERV